MVSELFLVAFILKSHENVTACKQFFSEISQYEILELFMWKNFKKFFGYVVILVDEIK